MAKQKTNYHDDASEVSVAAIVRLWGDSATTIGQAIILVRDPSVEADGADLRLRRRRRGQRRAHPRPLRIHGQQVRDVVSWLR